MLQTTGLNSANVQVPQLPVLYTIPLPFDEGVYARHASQMVLRAGGVMMVQLAVQRSLVKHLEA